MKPVSKQADVGVIVGRFQVHTLHDAHRALIKSVAEKHPKVLLFLGLAPVVSINNPLDYEARKQMILEEFPQINVLYIKDINSDEIWSAKLDTQIRELIGPNQTAVLYGSRDSFMSHYSGKFSTVELESEVFTSGTDVRKFLSTHTKASADFRAGAIWGAFQYFPTCYPTVDIAIIDYKNDKPVRLLLGRKEHETLYRFIGGFADPKSASYEDDAKRETQEETGLEVAEVTYIGSRMVDDWRYRGTPSKIKTLFFKAKYVFGAPKPDDDIAELKWFDLTTIQPADIINGHRHLFDMLTDNLIKTTK